MKTIKEVLELALTKLMTQKRGYICNEIKHIGAKKALITKTLNYFKENRPTAELHKEFFDNKFYNELNSVWWTVPQRDADSTLNFYTYFEIMDFRVQAERQRFLEYLISNIE